MHPISSIKRSEARQTAFARIELFVVIVSLVLLGLLAVPLLGSTRLSSDRAACANNLRQLGVAMFAYIDDHEQFFPPRPRPAWPQQLHSYYHGDAILLCPADGPMPGTFGPAT